MKKRLPAEAQAVNQLFAIALNGQLGQGDSVGVWTFSRDLHTGEFPLQQWTFDKIATVPQEIIAFVKHQHYSKTTRFDELIPVLNDVVRNSPRLTTVIFCDGDGELKGLPAAPTINAVFKAHYRAMEKGRVPFVIILRSQFGRYVGCTINSAVSIDLPHFPPLPAPPPASSPAAPKTPPPTETAPAEAAPLIIIGTNTETNMPPVATPPSVAPQGPSAPPPPPPAPATKPITPIVPVPPAVSPAPASPVIKTNSVPSPAALIQRTNSPMTPAQGIVRPNLPASTEPGLTHETARAGKGTVWAVCAGLLVLTAAAIFWILRQLRGRDSTSLITESLKKNNIRS